MIVCYLVYRSALGHVNYDVLIMFFICYIGEGATFGEIALINPDCIRTASVVAEDKTDLVAIHRELYNRSVSKVVAKEYAEKMDFIESLPIFEVSKVIFQNKIDTKQICGDW